MTRKKINKKKLKKKLLHKYRLVVLNEDTFEERIAFKLTRLNVFVLGSLIAILLVSKIPTLALKKIAFHLRIVLPFYVLYICCFMRSKQKVS